MPQVYTYYYPDRPPEIRREPLNGKGEVWVRGAYTPPENPSPLNVRVGESGVKIWMVIQWLKLSDNDPDFLLRRYGDVVSEEDVHNAIWFYEKHRAAMDQRIQEEMQPA